MHHLPNGEKVLILGLGDIDFFEKMEFANLCRDHLQEALKEIFFSEPKITIRLTPSEEDKDFNVCEAEFPEYIDFKDQEEIELEAELEMVLKDENGFVLIFEDDVKAEAASKVLEKAFQFDEDFDEKEFENEAEEFIEEEIEEEYWADEEGNEVSGPGGTHNEEMMEIVLAEVGDRKFKSENDLLDFFVKVGLEDSHQDANMSDIKKIYQALQKR